MVGGTCGDMMAHVVIWWVYLDYSVSSGPFLRFSMRFEFLSEMFDHSVCETREPSLTIENIIYKSFIFIMPYMYYHMSLSNYCSNLG